MGEPYFKIRHKLQRLGIRAFSSNYALYGDMSQRVMTLLEEMAPAVEVYSIDECFADLTGVPGDLVRVGREMRARVLRCTGIPVGGYRHFEDACEAGQPRREEMADSDWGRVGYSRSGAP